MTTIKPIETSYAGCRFRSRLEARWAVAFDHLGIEWQYELQGFQVTHRLTLNEGTFNYLPDFWLPGEGLWVEVKGPLNDVECLRLLDAAASLSSNDGGGCHDSGGHDVLVLGTIPRIPDPAAPEGARNLLGDHMPVRLHMHKGDLEVYAWPAQTPHDSDHKTLARDIGGSQVTDECGYSIDAAANLLLRGLHVGQPFPQRFLQAFAAARSARFEARESPSMSVESVVRNLLARYDVATIDGRVEALRRVAPILARAEASPERRAELARAIAPRLGFADWKPLLRAINGVGFRP